MDLRERFRDLWARLGAKGNPDEVFADLVKRYSEPHRFYHNLDHWEFGLSQFGLLADLASLPDLVEFAYGFHDSIYIIGARDNEEQSAELALEVAQRIGLGQIEQTKIADLILVTKHDKYPSTIDQEIIVDIDLAILGQESFVFDDYEREVRAEYASVDEATFWKIRKGILQGFLDRSRIYFTDRFQARYTLQAKENLLRTISSH